MICLSFLLVFILLPLCNSASTNPLDVPLASGTFRGVTTSEGVEEWLGIRFALPPVGSLRFKAPVPVPVSSGINTTVVDASTFGDACPQRPGNLGAPMGEDCLFLNFKKLIATHLTGIIQRSVTNGKPIMFVSTNYRVNTFGFIASSTVAPEDLNAGLHDQRLALEFVQDNIAAFGGDPSKVTIWGQSAGAGSVEAHLIFPANRTLFRAAMADSPVGPFKTSPPASVYDESDKPFGRLLTNTGCSDLECLRALPFETLLNISNALIDTVVNGQLWQPAVGPPGSFVPERASLRIRRGDFLHLPFLAGTNLNEGTIFSETLLPLDPPNSATASTADFFSFIRSLLIDDSKLTDPVLTELANLFPDNLAFEEMIPFETGNEIFDRGAYWYGAQMFLGPRRLLFGAAADKQAIFGYHFTEFIPGNNITFGVAHASELQLLYGPLTGPAAVETDFANTMLDFYLNFINDMTPGEGWPQYTLDTRLLLQLQRGNITPVPDGEKSSNDD
ncbi:hypothetical protein H0H92_014005 [Tricholoma furcatifolium]|nr:hypothetical protein H0H92_014005 [Tricholoma furcatifolium]